MVVTGKHAGELGYYDEDHGTKGLVYFGEPFSDDYDMVFKKWLMNVDKIHIPTEKWRLANPSLAKLLGVV